MYWKQQTCVIARKFNMLYLVHAPRPALHQNTVVKYSELRYLQLAVEAISNKVTQKSYNEPYICASF